jgi:hypothetical protein
MPEQIHQRVAVFLGSKNEVERVTRYHENEPSSDATVSLYVKTPVKKTKSIKPSKKPEIKEPQEPAALSLTQAETPSSTPPSDPTTMPCSVEAWFGELSLDLPTPKKARAPSKKRTHSKSRKKALLAIVAASAQDISKSELLR